jgi:hypothetical protein
MLRNQRIHHHLLEAGDAGSSAMASWSQASASPMIPGLRRTMRTQNSPSLSTPSPSASPSLTIAAASSGAMPATPSAASAPRRRLSAVMAPRAGSASSRNPARSSDSRPAVPSHHRKQVLVLLLLVVGAGTGRSRHDNPRPRASLSNWLGFPCCETNSCPGSVYNDDEEEEAKRGPFYVVRRRAASRKLPPDHRIRGAPQPLHHCTHVHR